MPGRHAPQGNGIPKILILLNSKRNRCKDHSPQTAQKQTAYANHERLMSNQCSTHKCLSTLYTTKKQGAVLFFPYPPNSTIPPPSLAVTPVCVQVIPFDFTLPFVLSVATAKSKNLLAVTSASPSPSSPPLPLRHPRLSPSVIPVCVQSFVDTFHGLLLSSLTSLIEDPGFLLFSSFATTTLDPRSESGMTTKRFLASLRMTILVGPALHSVNELLNTYNPRHSPSIIPDHINWIPD